MFGCAPPSVCSHVRAREHTIEFSRSLIFESIVACRSVARQRQRNKNLYASQCYVTAPQTSVFSWQHENTAIMEETFSMRSVPICYKRDQLAAVRPGAISEGFQCRHTVQ
jgi:hypothetical protein